MRVFKRYKARNTAFMNAEINIKNMKKFKALSYLMAGTIALSGMLISCESNPEVESQQDILPERFSVAIPEAISKSATSGRINGRLRDDSIRGNDMYRHLGTFIAIGKGS